MGSHQHLAAAADDDDVVVDDNDDDDDAVVVDDDDDKDDDEDDDCVKLLNGVTSTSCILPAPDLHWRRKLKETSLTEDSEWKENPSKDRKIKSNVSIMFHNKRIGQLVALTNPVNITFVNYHPSFSGKGILSIQISPPLDPW